MKYREVGTIFKHNGFNVEVVARSEAFSCGDCAFFDEGECRALDCELFYGDEHSVRDCLFKFRKDNKTVIFIKTNDPCNELVTVSELARSLNVCTQNIYKKIKRGMKTKKNKRGELVTSEAFLEEYKKNNPIGRPKK